MKVLIIKMTSMGDVIHTFPALTDASRELPSISFDWVVDSAFKELPAWHPAVDKVIPVALRRWRKNPWHALKSGEVRKAIKAIRAEKYDLIIDAQGLLKSAIVASLARGKHCGLNSRSAREVLATLFYRKRVSVKKGQHAVARVRKLFAKALGYDFSVLEPEYGIAQRFPVQHKVQDYLLFMHGTTWDTKHWPEHYWLELIGIARENQYPVLLPWGSEHEKQRAERLAKDNQHVTVLPKKSLTEMAQIIAHAKAIVALDSGLTHMAAALSIPTVSLYGSTNPELTGAVGDNQTCLAAKFECAPCLSRTCHYQGNAKVKPACFETLPPKYVWQQLQEHYLA